MPSVNEDETRPPSTRPGGHASFGGRERKKARNPVEKAVGEKTVVPTEGDQRFGQVQFSES